MQTGKITLLGWWSLFVCLGLVLLAFQSTLLLHMDVQGATTTVCPAGTENSGQAGCCLDDRILPTHPGRVYMGLQLSFADNQIPRSVVAAAGDQVHLFGEYAQFPIDEITFNYLKDEVMPETNLHGIFVLSLLPLRLVDYSQADLDVVASLLNALNAAGTQVLVRFGHEMNGNWYAWGQQPGHFVAAFRIMAAVVRKTPNSFMLSEHTATHRQIATNSLHGSRSPSLKFACCMLDIYLTVICCFRYFLFFFVQLVSE
jgi:hypothetical protein